MRLKLGENFKDGSSSEDEDTGMSDSDNSVDSDETDSDSDSNSDGVPNSSEARTEDIGSSNTVDTVENEEEEDEILKALTRERTKCRTHPPDIQSDDFVVDISFHPQEHVIAAATITGDVVLYKYTNENTEIISTLEVHTKACRAVEFSEDGNTLFSTSKDKSIVLSDFSTGKMKVFYDNAHEDPLYCLLVLDENRFVSGDDNGVVKLWDIRNKDPIFSLKEMDDYVSCMISTEAKKYLVCASGDGTITSIDIGARKLHVQSEMYEEELTCMATLRSESKLLVGSSKGNFYVFNWGQFGYHNDVFPGPKVAANCLLPITENIVVCAGEDGALRATNFFPQRHIGVVGQHQFSVESLDMSGSGEIIASCSHDQTIKFWNIKYFEDIEVDGKKKAKKRELNHNLPSSKCSNVSDFFSELK